MAPQAQSSLAIAFQQEIRLDQQSGHADVQQTAEMEIAPLPSLKMALAFILDP